VAHVTQESLRRNIGMVTQDTSLLHRSIRDNIRYGRPDATEAELLEASKRAHADDFIQGLTDAKGRSGYDTQVGERGVKLSGGQRQRIAIARALLADPRILILDEATSLVDTEAEQLIQQALDDLRRNRTTFVIAHRLSTVRNADKIVVLDDGRVVEEDRHEKLMEAEGLYAEMYNRQFRLQDVWWSGGLGMGGGAPDR